MVGSTHLPHGSQKQGGASVPPRAPAVPFYWPVLHQCHTRPRPSCHEREGHCRSQDPSSRPGAWSGGCLEGRRGHTQLREEHRHLVLQPQGRS